MSISNSSNLTFYQFNLEDVLGLINLSTSVGWDYHEEEVKTLLLSGKVFGHKNEAGKVVSSAAIIPYGNDLAFIGKVIVHKDYRGVGLASKVMKACMDQVSKETTMLLIATQQGKPLYEKLHFEAVDCVHKFLCENYISHSEESKDHNLSIEEYKDSDLEAIIRLDEAAFGGSRRQFLMNRINQADQSLLVKDKNGRTVGFGLSILGPANLTLGPIIAPNQRAALMLIDRLSKGHTGKCRIDVTSGKEDFMSQLMKRGFEKVSQPPVMASNSRTMPNRNNTLFSIASQAFG